MKWQAQWRVIYIYMKSKRKNKWEGNLWQERNLVEIKGRSTIGISESGRYIRSWSSLRKFCNVYVASFKNLEVLSVFCWFCFCFHLWNMGCLQSQTFCMLRWGKNGFWSITATNLKHKHEWSLIGIILRWGLLIWELIFIYCGLFVLILVVFLCCFFFHYVSAKFSPEEGQRWKFQCSPKNRMFAKGPGDRGSVPGRVIPTTQKMVLDAPLPNTQHYKVRIKGKVEQYKEWSGTQPYSSVW